MTLADLITIPLADAYLCADVDCSTISNRSDYCPVCFSHVLSVWKLMNRPEAKKEVSA